MTVAIANKTRNVDEQMNIDRDRMGIYCASIISNQVWFETTSIMTTIEYHSFRIIFFPTPSLQLIWYSQQGTFPTKPRI